MKKLEIISGLLLLLLGLTNTYLPRPPCKPTNVILQCLQRRTNVSQCQLNAGEATTYWFGYRGMYNKILIISSRITRLAPTWYCLLIVIHCCPFQGTNQRSLTSQSPNPLSHQPTNPN